MRTTNLRWTLLSVSALLPAAVTGFWRGASAEDHPTAQGTIPEVPAAMNEKATRTPAQKRLDSQLVYAIQKMRGETGKELPRRIGVDIRGDGRVLVDLEANVSKELLALIEQNGGQIINNFPTQNAIRALIPLANLETVAIQSDVRFIRPAVGARTQK